jgi:hypothetical protein
MRLGIRTRARRSCESDGLVYVACHDAGTQIGPNDGLAAAHDVGGKPS